MEAVTDGYDEHGIAWFRTTCTLKHGKKTFVPPRNWAALSPLAPSMRRAGNAVCIRTGPGAAPAGSDRSEGRHIVVVDADGVDAIAVVERVIQHCAPGFLARVPQVETQRGPSGRHFYFFAQSGAIAATLKSTAGLTIDGAKDWRRYSRGLPRLCRLERGRRVRFRATNRRYGRREIHFVARPRDPRGAVYARLARARTRRRRRAGHRRRAEPESVRKAYSADGAYCAYRARGARRG
jgi:hypothetical protein